MIIDCHGHYTTAPAAHDDFRTALLAQLDGRGRAVEPYVSDDQIRESLENNQLRLMRERGGDLTLFSPRASSMGHHVRDLSTARTWARACNDLVHRAVGLYPDRFAGVCQLPQTPEDPAGGSVAELTRCVEELGFVGCLLNPDPSGGYWTGEPITSEVWFPLYERLVALDVPAMIHVSDSTNPNFHHTGAHYLNADTSVFMQLVLGDLFQRFPGLRLVIPHGGGAVPFHWGRYRGIAARMGRPDIVEHVMGNVFFDTCVYHQPGMELLVRTVGVDNLLFGSEMLGAVRAEDPRTGVAWDDTRQYVEALGLSAADRDKVLQGNARRVFPRLDARLRGVGS
jgi:4-oxalmesaconate hydratase